ncbi:hypothetical protein M5689_016096 [Euphorbia peplus]|nr:hypothetical protein M5689_016096 [Euphorbia peplus]
MGNSLRCCLACVIPCGALDLIRIVHLNGVVEEITHPITAGEILKSNPNHVLSKPCCSQGVSRKILILSPESELKRGSIYFLIPAAASLPENKKNKKKKSSSGHRKNISGNDQLVSSDSECESDRKVKVLAPVSKSSSRREHHHRRSGSRIGVWRPHLQSIIED